MIYSFRLWLESREDEFPGRLPLSSFVSLKDIDRVYRSNYFDDQGGKVASSRTTPAARQLPVPLGTWVIEDWKGIHGHEIGQLRLVDPGRLRASEDTGPEKREDVQRYAEWLRQGLVPPPINVVETDAGGYAVTDGHRRWLAAKLAHVNVPAIVWPLADHPEGLKYGGEDRVLRVGLTYELARRMAAAVVPVRFAI